MCICVSLSLYFTLCQALHANGSFRIFSFISPRDRKSVYIHFFAIRCDHFCLFVQALLSLSLCCGFFLDSPSRCLTSYSNPDTLLSPPVSAFFPAFNPLPPSQSSLLQVVKWILLSQSHQGKGRKRKRIEPKVNYKEVGGTLLY